MFNVEKKEEILAAFASMVEEGFNENSHNYNIEEAMDKDDVDRVREIVRAIQANVIACIPTGMAIPKASMYVSPLGEEGAISIVTVTISNRVNSDKDFKFTYTATKANAAKKISDFIQDVYNGLLVDIMIDENLKQVNEALSDAAKAAGIPYSVRVISPLGQNGRKIAYMSDDELVFVADEARALALDDILVFHDPDEFITQERIDSAKEDLANDLAKAQTTEELVGQHGGMLIHYVSDISNRVKPMTLISKICNKNALKLRGAKDSIAYYKEGNVFALVARRDGHFEVLLSPFDTETLNKVDFDVLKALA